MKQINHHLTDELLMGYSAGTLPEAFNLLVAAHLSMCDECRAALAACDAVGGALLDDTSDVAVDDDALAKTMAMIENALPFDVPKPTTGDLPAPLQDYVGQDLSSVKWQSLGMGVRQSILKTSKDASVRLLHIPAGAAVPDHGHKGTELTLVLKGAFRDEVDHFAPGDVEVANEDLEHTPIADIGEDCICLAATDAPLRFNAFLPRLLQPFFRI